MLLMKESKGMDFTRQQDKTKLTFEHTLTEYGISKNASGKHGQTYKITNWPIFEYVIQERNLYNYSEILYFPSGLNSDL